MKTRTKVENENVEIDYVKELANIYGCGVEEILQDLEKIQERMTERDWYLQMKWGFF